MRGRGESGRHAPVAKEAREGKGEQERMKRVVDPPERFGILLVRTGWKGLHARYIRECYSRARLGEKGKDRRGR